MRNSLTTSYKAMVSVIFLVALAAGCSKWNGAPVPPAGPAGPTATFTVTGSATSTATPTRTVTATATVTSTGTLSPTPTATFTPTATATATTTSTATVTPTGTLVAPCPNPAAVNLGTAGNYVMLAETGITDVPSSAVTGDIGNSGLGTQIGISCAEVTGVIYKYDGTGASCNVQATAALDIATTDRGTAYTTDNGQANCVSELGAGTLSGLTLTRGKYIWAGNVTIPTDLHLDALGDPNARWIFQIGGTLTMASAMNIILDNGALASNITWTVADFVQIGTTAHMEGTVMSASYIAMQTGASIHGRLLTHTQITLDQNVVTDLP